MRPSRLVLVLLLVVATGCDSATDTDTDAVDSRSAAADSRQSTVDSSDVQSPDAVPGTDAAAVADTFTDAAADAAAPARTFVAVTFNTGTTEMMGTSDPDDRYTPEHAASSDAWYGDGLAWLPAVDAARAFLAEVDPDVIVFQEIFWSGACPDVPAEDRVDFVCESWQDGQPTVAQVILGPDYQVVCHPEKPDKCAAVHRRFGTFRGCDEDICLEGLVGYRVEDCGRGARVGRGVIDLVDGGSLTLVSVHGSSGLDADSIGCRVRQFEQIFVDLGDGAPAANGAHDLVMGDFNTDPARLAIADASARRLNDFVGDGLPFHFLTDVGVDVPATYGGFGNIDHVISNDLTGSCWTAGVTEGHPAVLEDRYFDHNPVVCDVVGRL